MKNQRGIIEWVEIFNDAQQYTGGNEYVSCFYSSLFTYLVSQRKDILPYISNMIFIYNYNSKERDLRSKYGIIGKGVRPIENLYKDSHILIKKEIIKTENILEEIKKSIKQNELISVGVDLFYLSYRLDRYMKVHTNHFILVYGYDEEKRILYIIDNPQNSIYSKVILSFEDFFKAFDSALVDRSENLDNTFIFKGIEGEEVIYNHSYYMKQFMKNLLNSKEYIYSGIQTLPIFENEFISIVSDRSILEERGMNLFNLVHYHILNKKKSEKYAFIKMFGERSEIVRQIDFIINRWEMIRNACFYYVESKKYVESRFKKAATYLKILCKEEKEFYDLLFEFCQSELQR